MPFPVKTVSRTRSVLRMIAVSFRKFDIQCLFALKMPFVQVPGHPTSYELHRPRNVGSSVSVVASTFFDVSTQSGQPSEQFVSVEVEWQNLDTRFWDS